MFALLEAIKIMHDFRKMMPGQLYIKKSNEKDATSLPIVVLEVDITTSMCIVAKYYSDLPVISFIPTYIVATEYKRVSNKKFVKQILKNCSSITDEELLKDQMFLGMRQMYMAVAYGEKDFESNENYEEFVKANLESIKKFEEELNKED